MSRVQKSLQNTKVGLILYAFLLLVSFFSRKYFIEYLGSELLGLTTLAMSLLNVLNLAELGFGSAVAFSLYKPLLQQDRKTISDIISVQAFFYRAIAFIILGGAIILSFFFPYFFEKSTLPLIYAYAIFAVFLFGNLLSFFFNYKQIIFEADQNMYIVSYIMQGGRCLKFILQIFAIIYLPHPFLAWLILEILFSVGICIGLQYAIKKYYPWLSASASFGGKIRKNYPEIMQKTKQIFFHKIGGVALYQVSPLIIYAYASLVLVAIYGNYMLIVSGVTTLIANTFNGMNASIGNLIAENDTNKIKKVFWELFSFRFWMVGCLCIGLFFLSSSFVTLWVGTEYLLDYTALWLIIAIAFIQMTRGIVDSFISAYGLFHDVWAPITETALNIGLSIFLGYFFGLHGILIGVLISLILIVGIWKPIFLFEKKMPERIFIYFLNYAKYCILILVSALALVGTLQILPSFEILHFGHLALYGIEILALYGFISFILFYISSKGIRNLCKRFIRAY